LHEFDTVRSTLFFHALAKKREQVEAGDAYGKYIVSQCIGNVRDVGG
jgi:hypothetical protein